MKQKLTKMVATVSDLRCDKEFLQKLFDNGVNIVRINTAHATKEGVVTIIERVRELNSHIALMIDTKGPEIRTTSSQQEITINAGECYTLGYDSKESIIQCDYQDTMNIPTNTQLLVDDGQIIFTIVGKHDNHLILEAHNSGVIKPRKSINIPHYPVNLPALTQKDIDFIHLAIEHQLDFIAHSFVRNKEDIKEIQDILDQHNSSTKIIAKIENQEGIDNIDEILSSCYGIMVARGDLAVEIPNHKIPLLQKFLIKKSHEHGKPAITATQMLHSMMDNPTPTRAELTDIANAIYDGSDALMLSGETANGKFPHEAVQLMSTVAQEVESSLPYKQYFEASCSLSFVMKNIVEASYLLPIAAIIIDAPLNTLPQLSFSLKSKKPIYTTCSCKHEARQLNLCFGIHPYSIPNEDESANNIKTLINELVHNNLLSTSEQVIIVKAPHNDTSSITFSIAPITQFFSSH